MFLKFEKLEGKNFLGMSNNMFKYEFESGFINIVGENGSGKSQWVDLLTWVIYGRTFRKIKKASIVNKQNNKDTWGRVSILVDNQRVVVTRGLKPNIFEIEIDGVKVQELSHATDDQKTLDKIIGLPFELFKMVIVLSTTQTSSNFIEMTPQERRDIVSNIFSLGYVDGLLKVAKTKLTDSKVDFKLIETTKDLKNIEINNLNQLINRFKENSSVEQLKAELKQIKSDGQCLSVEIDGYKSDITKMKTEFGELEKQLNEIKISESEVIQDRLRSQNLVSEIAKCEDDIEDIDTQCQVCGGDLSELKIRKVKQKLTSNLDIVKLEKSKLDKELPSKESRLKKVIKINEKLNIIKEKATSLIHRKKEAQSTIDSKMVLAKSIQQSIKASDSDIKSTEDSLIIAETEYSDILNKLKECDTKIANLTLMTKEILSDSGFKSFYIKKYLPIINDYVNNNIRDLGLPFSFLFDSEFSFELYSTLNRSEFEYGQMSEGQKKKLDLSITLAFISIMKDISNWDSNLLIFDEVLDSGLDKKSTESVINGLRELFMVDGWFKNVVIISHKIDNDTLFDKTLSVKLENGFSNYEWEN